MYAWDLRSFGTVDDERFLVLARTLKNIAVTYGKDYEVLNLLGKGGFASVYRARCLKTGIEVAIKMIDKKLMQAAGMVGRVRQEVAIHSRLKHPSVLELYTFFEDENYVYLVLELCHHGELQRYLKNSAIVLDEEEGKFVTLCTSCIAWPTEVVCNLRMVLSSAIYPQYAKPKSHDSRFSVQPPDGRGYGEDKENVFLNAPSVHLSVSKLQNEEWNSIKQTVIQNLIEGLNRQMAAVLQSQGGNTCY
ncbi:hypothetical protein ANN_17520 [Periplaneta americana]|uniref:Protein kinase domain-containing protein n=1 Tax=Periplaneta americana TaxID=6978 RepID=A0ABQ8SUK7_PERAM|nr:hypothetical protein ANN_17520 [Periplaneta americana]